MHVRVRKIGAVAKPVSPSAEWSRYILGEDNGDVSLPIEYELEGHAMADPVLNKPYIIACNKRNGVVCDGIFTSTPIKSITTTGYGQIIETANTIYTIHHL
jgi:hypothetical protein